MHLGLGLEASRAGQHGIPEETIWSLALWELNPVSCSNLLLAGICKSCWLDFHVLLQTISWCFWSTALIFVDVLQDMLCVPERRLLEDSKNLPISASTNRSDRILLFDDVLVLIQVNFPTLKGDWKKGTDEWHWNLRSCNTETAAELAVLKTVSDPRACGLH